MKTTVDKYLEAEEDLERVSEDINSSFMDVSVRIDRVRVAKQKAIQELGELALQAILITKNKNRNKRNENKIN